MRLEVQGTLTTNRYDANGNYVKSVSDTKGNTVLLGNDATGNKTSVTDAKSKITSFGYNPLNLLTKEQMQKMELLLITIMAMVTGQK